MRILQRLALKCIIRNNNKIILIIISTYKKKEKKRKYYLQFTILSLSMSGKKNLHEGSIL